MRSEPESILGAESSRVNAAVAAWGGNERTAGATPGSGQWPQDPPRILGHGNLLEGQTSWSRPGMRLNLWSWELFVFCWANLPSPPHSGFWDVSVMVQCQQWITGHQNESPSPPFSLMLAAREGNWVGQMHLLGAACVQNGSALAWQQEGFNGIAQWCHQHFLLLQRERPTENTFLPAHTQTNKALPGKGVGMKQRTGFYPHIWGKRERMVPSVCIKIQNGP